MTCFSCGAQHRSSPKEESNWNCFQIGDGMAYLCPGCWSVPNLVKVLEYLVKKK